MEVSVRRHTGSGATNTRLLCGPCESAGDAENAENYCLDCHEFLCITCAKVHIRQAISKGHLLLRHDEMPKQKITTQPEYTCRKHEGKPYDYYCKVHDVLCCSVCLNLDHRQCPVEYITDLVERFERGGKYEALRTKMRNLDELIEETKTRTDSNITASKRAADQLVSNIQKFRAEINAHLESLEKKVLEKAHAIKDENIQAMSAIAEELSTMKAELDALKAKLEGLSKFNRNRELVIASKLADKYVNTIENKVGKLTKQNHTRQFKFHHSDGILDMLQSTDFGKIEEMKEPDKGSVAGTKVYKALTPPKVEEMKAPDRDLVARSKVYKAVTPPQSFKVRHMININIKHKEDKSKSNVTGSVMMGTGRLAITDYTNYSVKVVDTNQGNILSCTRLLYRPWDITYTDQNQLIVTDPDMQTLIFLDVGNTLTVNKELKVYGECRGIYYTDNKMIVSFVDPGSVKVLNMDGHVLSSISNDSNDKPLFSCPYRVISNADSSAIYVSDYNQNTVTKLDMTGRVIYKYTSNDCQSPYGIVVDQHDNLYIAGYMSSTVCILSAEGRQIITIKVDYPQSVALCETTDKLFVSFPVNWNNSLSVYKLL